MSTNDRDVLIGWIGALDLRDETGRTDDIECGDTEETLGIIDALALEDLGNDGDGRVDLGLSVSFRFLLGPHIQDWR